MKKIASPDVLISKLSDNVFHRYDGYEGKGDGYQRGNAEE